MAELCDHKLDVLKLSEEPVQLTGGLLAALLLDGPGTAPSQGAATYRQAQPLHQWGRLRHERNAPVLWKRAYPSNRGVTQKLASLDARWTHNKLARRCPHLPLRRGIRPRADPQPAATLLP